MVNRRVLPWPSSEASHSWWASAWQIVVIAPTKQALQSIRLESAANPTGSARFGSNRFRHQLGDVRHRVWLPLSNSSRTQIEPALGVALGLHAFSNDLPVIDFSLIHGKDEEKISIILEIGWMPPRLPRVVMTAT